MKIGVVTRILIENGNKKEFVNNNYLLFLSKYDLTPIIITTFTNEYILDLCDGFLLPGGDDVNPSYYSKQMDELTNVVLEEVDSLDFKVLDYAIKNSKPVLGICRGLQVINVYFRGSLINILDGKHLNKEIDYMKICKDSTFVNYRNRIEKINSYHHQKIDKLGNDLFIEAISNEAIEIISSKKYKLIATQYHIEKLNDSLSKEIIRYFINLFSL